MVTNKNGVYLPDRRLESMLPPLNEPHIYDCSLFSKCNLLQILNEPRFKWN